MKKNFLEKKSFDNKKFNSISEQNIFNLFNKPKFQIIPKNENLKSNLKNFFQKIKNEKKPENVVKEEFFKCDNIGTFVKKLSKVKKYKSKNKKKNKLRKTKGGIKNIKNNEDNDIVMDLYIGIMDENERKKNDEKNGEKGEKKKKKRKLRKKS